MEDALFLEGYEVPTRRALRERRTQKKYLWYVPVLLLLAILVSLLLRTTVAAGFVVEQHSMEPTLIEGDALLVNKMMEPHRGDIVMLNGWDSGDVYVKRIVGVPGDVVSFVDGSLWLNGEPSAESYMKSDTDNYEVTVPKGMFWVLGDNRPMSSDSREHGFIPATDIIGVAYYRYWPFTGMGAVGHTDD